MSFLDDTIEIDSMNLSISNVYFNSSKNGNPLATVMQVVILILKKSDRMISN